MARTFHFMAKAITFVTGYTLMITAMAFTEYLKAGVQVKSITSAAELN